jgi:hypothetical protein
MSKIKFDINVTLSKLLGYIIVLTGIAFAVAIKDPSVFIAAAGIGGSLVGVKTVVQDLKTKNMTLKTKAK